MKINLRFFSTLQGIILGLIIAIFGVAVLSGFVNSKSTADDQKRISDLTQIQAGLKVAYDINGFYPASVNNQPKGIESVLDFWPTAPQPDGSCTITQNKYIYSQLSNGSDYAVTFCLGGSLNGISSGIHTLSSGGVK